MSAGTIGERWEKGIPHDPRSVALYQAIADLDFQQGGDRFCFKSGGDGDNGEHLMFLLDVHFSSFPPEPRENVPDWIWGAISQLSCGNWEINCMCGRCNERREAQLWLDARFPETKSALRTDGANDKGEKHAND